MPKPLIVQFAGTDLPLEIARVERSDLYGYIETEALDAKGRRCTSATLADDGQTIIASGGSAFATLSTEGQWLEKSSLKPVNAEGNLLTPVPSSFAAPVPLAQTATIDEYLTYNIRSIYTLSSEGDMAPLIAKLKEGVIFTFPYSYRGGLEPDTAFLLLAADGTPFLAIGDATKQEFVALDQPAAGEDESAPAEAGDIDFGMM
jgi:hypothetical protein